MTDDGRAADTENRRISRSEDVKILLVIGQEQRVKLATSPANSCSIFSTNAAVIDFKSVIKRLK